MKLTIAPDQTIARIQEDFQSAFPYLKLAFFSKPHKAFKSSHAKFLITDPHKKLGDLLKPDLSGVVGVFPEMHVWQLEQLLEKEFGLHVQVFRKSGNTWLETSVTDHLTLEEQNAKGKAAEHIQFEFVDPIDYREQE